MGSWLAPIAGVLVVIDTVIYLLAMEAADPSDGANIGAGIALLSALAAGVSAALALASQHPWLRPLRNIVFGAAVFALVIAAKGTFLVLWGVLEEVDLR